MEKIVTSITEKDIENLPQLDRIEYKLANEKINTGITDFVSFWCMKKWLIPISFMLVFIYYAGDGILRNQVLEEMLVRMVKALLIFCLIIIPFDIYILFRDINKKRELDNKFFNKKEEKWKKRKK